ncbi:Kv channel-interacting protein 1-like isoform X7 [Varroa jacobsoni]|uniref:Kv channel-interacting protein 1-like isoform X7 n=1 Tax=Varroa jacobsoni TaxID=62625 RepID=UPI000BF41BFF|nr:Kv channel-interacting protein 1-like isoform X7 [Varroa jacobsoni]
MPSHVSTFLRARQRRQDAIVENADETGLNKGSDNEDNLEEEPEVKNLKYWASKIGHVFRKVRPTKKRRKTSYGSLFSSLGDSELDELEGPTVHYKPEAIETLCQLTKFNRRELQLMYRGFKQECPSGMVKEDTFKMIYSQFFPRGADASQYAHFVFNTFDQDNTGAITFTDFVIGLSVLSRGSLQEKLRWTFNLYDINGDGYITKDELSRIVKAVYDLMGRAVEPLVEEHTTREHVERVFNRLDLNKDGVVTIDEFMDSCTKDENISKSMAVLDTIL